MTTPNIGAPFEGAANYEGLAAFAAKTEEDWREELQLPLETSAGEFRDGLWGDLPLDVGSFILTLLTELARKILPLDQIAEWPLVSDVLAALDDWGSALNGILGPLLEVGEAIISSIFGFLGWLWSNFEEAVDDIVEIVLKPFFGLVVWVWTEFGNVVEGFVDNIVKPIISFLVWVWTNFGEAVEDIAEMILKPVVDFIVWAWTTVGDLVEDVVDIVEDFLKPVVEFLAGLMGDFGSLEDWLSNLPIIGDLAQAITGVVEGGIADIEHFFKDVSAGGVSLIEGILGAFDQIVGGNFFNWVKSQINWDNIQQAIESAFSGVLGTIPVAHVNTNKVNLLNLGSFRDNAALTSADGWVWDSSNNRSEAAGGSAKVTCNGTERVLYSNQNIRVAAGDRLVGTAYVNTSNFNGNSTSIQMKLVCFAGAVQKSVVTLCSRGVSNGAWGKLDNEATPYEIPAAALAADQITSVQVRLSVGSTATTGTVNWDDVALYKDGGLQQNLVDSLLDAWDNLWNGLTGATGQTGKTWEELLGAAQSVRTVANTGVSKGDTAIGLNTTLSGNLANAPAAVLGSLFSVIVDGSKTFAQFLSLLYDALNGTSGSSNKTATNVSTAGSGFRGAYNTTSTNFSTLNGTLFGQSTPGSTVLPGALPMTGIGATILPGPGSGAMLTRRIGTYCDLSAGRQRLQYAITPPVVTNGFFNSLDVASDDIQALNHSDQAVTGTSRNDYAGVFKVLYDGWYLCEIGLRNRYDWSLGFRYAAVLYRSTDYPTVPLTVYRVGSDALGTPLNSACRYTQSSFIVYLPAGGAVAAGVDASWALTDFLEADPDGAETYFSIALLNRSYE